MRARLPWSLTAALLLAPVSCAQCGDSSRPRPPVHVEEPSTTVPERPVGWPYWGDVAVDIKLQAAPYSLPLSSVQRSGGAEARWVASSPATREQLLTRGFARGAAGTRGFSVGAFYEGLRCDQVPAFLTVEALVAVSFVTVEAALRDAEGRTLRAMKTLLQRLDVRLAAAEPGAQPDLTAGLHVAEGVVAVGLALLDGAYVPPGEVSVVVAAELARIHAHVGVAPSPILEVPVDYSVFTPRGALTEATGPYLAAQWLAGASFAFGAGEGSSRVDMSAARARTRAALLIARLITTGSDADQPARDAMLELDRLGELAFGEPDGTPPGSFARFVLGTGFDLHDASAIARAASLDRVRRAAATSLGAMELVPLRRAPEAEAWPAGVAAPRALDVTEWLESSGRRAPGRARHGSFYSSALDAVSTWLAPSAADGSSGSLGQAWQEHKPEGAVAAWALLRHGAVPYARVGARPRPSEESPSPCPAAASKLTVERHPEAIAALLGHVRQVTGGLMALRALDDGAPSRDLLVEVQGILELALSAAETPGGATHGLADVPRRLAAVEARLGPVAGPFAAIVYTDPGTGKALEEASAGLDSVLVVVPDPETGRPELAVGAVLAEVESWVPANAVATDQEWAKARSGLSGPAP